MHRAPAVSFDIGKSRSHKVIISVLWALGWVAFSLFCLDQSTPTLIAFVALTLCGAGFIAWRGWHLAALGVLRWDGQNWYWSEFGAASPCQLVLAFDLQTWMLVSLRTHAKRTVWLWLDAPAAGPKWTALRRAIVAYGQLSDHPTSPIDAVDLR
jgi:toxin CptA